MSGLWGDGGPYAAWVGFLRRWAALEPVDPGTLPAIVPEDFQGDTLARLTKHLTDAMDARLNDWAERLLRAMAHSTDEFSVGRELAQARAGLNTVRALAGHPGLPPKVREELTGLVDRQIPEIQAQLERNLDVEARRGADPRLLERRRRTLRENALTSVLAAPPPPLAPPSVPPSAGRRSPVSGPAAGGDAWAYDPAARPRRRIVPD
ncbi:hypothetical protein [Streptomyces avermitilis]|uniref:hypothetical protein n=1 Tax=Streptomyces avermitilis TaxID=33903 RepID=UPI0036B28027